MQKLYALTSFPTFYVIDITIYISYIVYSVSNYSFLFLIFFPFNVYTRVKSALCTTFIVYSTFDNIL